MIVAAYAIAIVGISILIVLHEAGHFAVARLFGLRVLRFSIGFGPALVSRRIGETIWQVAAVPLGGYVQIAGMGPREADEPENSKSFRGRPAWQRALILFAGPAANWLLAAVFLAVSAWTVGIARHDEHGPAILGELTPDKPAEQAGLHTHDQIVAISDVAIYDWESMTRMIRANPDAKLVFNIVRDGQPLAIEVTPQLDARAGYAIIGVSPWAEVVKYGPVDGTIAGFEQAAIAAVQQVEMLWGMAVGKREGHLSGLPGIVKLLSQGAVRGPRVLFEFLASLSVTLFLLNLLPVPALDGSRLVFVAIEVVRRKPINERVEGIVHAVGFALLLTLMVLVSIRDLL